MKQNYNTPVFIWELGENELPSADSISAAFKAVYPTFKEARLFALSGGACFIKGLDDSESLPAGSYYYAPFSINGVADAGTFGSIAFKLLSGTIYDVQYLTDSGQGGGGES